MRIVIALFLLLLSITPGRAEPETVMSLIQAGRYEEARGLAERNTQGRPDAAIDLAFVEGMILVHQKRDREAAVVFQSILKAHPRHEPARVELAGIAMRAGRYDIARAQFSLLADSTQGARRDAFARYARLAEDRTTTGAGFAWDGYLSLTPSTNVNKSSTKDTFKVGDQVFVISDDSRAKEGIGINFGGSVIGYLPAFGGTLQSVTKLDATIYTSGGTDLTLSESPQFVYQWDRTKIAFGPVIEHRWIDEESYWWRYGIQADILHRINDRFDLFASQQVLRQDFTELHYRDGYLTTTDALLRYKLAEATYVSLSAGVTYESARVDYLEHLDGRVAVQVDHAFENGLNVSARVGYERHQFQGDFPGLLEARQDDQVSVRLAFSHEKFEIGGFLPEIGYKYTRQVSNVSFYDYDSHDILLDFKKAF